jgi:hypothetical protein
MFVLAVAALGCTSREAVTDSGSVDASATADSGFTCEGEEDNECGGCGDVIYEPQSVPVGQPCVYFWLEDNAGDCATVGVGACRGLNAVVCDAPEPECAP